ncbi:MAG TPA: alanine racemase [Bryobacteraceae bacterium]|nr:alanine racemase [Bryobacteraceae bacterium]
MHISDLDTPALLIDVEIMERNLQRAAEYARAHGLRLRPHTKTHKIPALGRRQLDLGAVGLTVAKVGEAEVMLRSEPPDLLLAYPLFGRQKLARLMQVARRTRVTVSLDDPTAAAELAAAARQAAVEVGVLAEMDVGMGRVGVDPGSEVVELARRVAGLPFLRFEGVAFFPGHINPSLEDGQIERLAETVGQVVQSVRAAGLEVRIVSGGSTPLLYHSHRIRGMNEIRPGTYIFNDRNTALWGGCALADCAATILTTVVSTARPGQVVIDAGSKTLSSDLAVNGAEGYGQVVEAPAAVVRRLNEEHGYVDIREVSGTWKIGDRLHIIPNHVCVTVNLQESVYGIRGETVEQVWEVEARGKVR